MKTYALLITFLCFGCHESIRAPFADGGVDVQADTPVDVAVGDIPSTPIQTCSSDDLVQLEVRLRTDYLFGVDVFEVEVEVTAQAGAFYSEILDLSSLLESSIIFDQRICPNRMRDVRVSLLGRAGDIFAVRVFQIDHTSNQVIPINITR